jgi:hypothetical protein
MQPGCDVCLLGGASGATLGGEERLASEDLRKFRISLKKGAVKVLYIHPARD